MTPASFARLLSLSAVLLLAHCSTSKPPGTDLAAAADELDDYASTSYVADPLEPLNRATFKLNDAIYDAVLRPITKAYETVTPKVVRSGLDNFFENAKYPVRLVNSGLQGKFRRAGHETEKFALNTIAGFGGLIKQSDRLPHLTNIPAEDTGQTLATWGIGHGPYLVLPVFGPSSVREGIGYATDNLLNPVNWGAFQSNDALKYIPPSMNSLCSLPAQRDNYDLARQDAIDPYLSVRSSFIQNRNAAAKE